MDINLRALRSEIAKIIVITQYQNYIAPAPKTAFDFTNLKKEAVDMYLGKESKKWNSLQVCRFHQICEGQINYIMQAIQQALKEDSKGAQR